MTLPDPLVSDSSVQRNFDALDKRVTDLEGRPFADHDIGATATTLTTTMAAVTDSSLTVDVAGTYLVWGIFDFNVTVLGVGFCGGEVYNNTATTSHCGYAIYSPASVGRATVVTPAEKLTLAAGDELICRANKSIAAGTAATGAYTSIALIACT